MRFENVKILTINLLLFYSKFPCAHIVSLTKRHSFHQNFRIFGDYAKSSSHKNLKVFFVKVSTCRKAQQYKDKDVSIYDLGDGECEVAIC